jgi:hypothetical protein
MAAADFDGLVAEFLRREKIAPARPRWQIARHGDYAEAKLRLGVPGSRTFQGRLILTAHRVRFPPKYCLALLFRGERILGLDINPARSHRNLLAPLSVASTHWHRWPMMEAAPDERELTFTVWLGEFFKEANVSTSFGVLSPPRGVQLRLLLDGDSDSRRN